MTVIGDSGISQRMWRGYDDPGLPVGMYLASQTVVGDVSGGNMLIIFTFRDEAEPVSGRFYNIEQLEVMRSGAPINGFLQSINFEAVGPTGLVNFERRLRLEDDRGTFGNALDPGASVRFPLFLGSAQAVAALTASVNIGFPNADALVLAVSIQGYIWEARSILAVGGLRRPLDSLYGR